MARTRTVAELITESLQLADMESVSNFVDNSLNGETTRYINQGIAELYDLMIQSFGEEWYMFQNQSIVTEAGTAEYDIFGDATDNFYLLRGVDLVVDSNTCIPLSPYNFLDRHQDSRLTSRSGLGRNAGAQMQYRLTGDLGGDGGEGAAGDYQPRIRFTPTPQAAHTIRLWYFGHAPELVDGDSWDGFNGWEEYATVFAAIKLRNKEESDTTDLLLRKQELVQRISDIAANRDLGRNEVIYDIEGDYGGDFYDL